MKKNITLITNNNYLSYGLKKLRNILPPYFDSNVIVFDVKKNYFIVMEEKYLNTELTNNLIDIFSKCKRFNITKMDDLAKYIELSICVDYSSFSSKQKLTSKEKIILQQLYEGKSTAHIARILELSPKTVSAHATNASKKLGFTKYRFFFDEFFLWRGLFLQLIEN